MHPSEIAAVMRHAATNPAPGSIEEREALQAIDRARHDEVSPPSHKALRRRARRHWSDRDHALEGR